MGEDLRSSEISILLGGVSASRGLGLPIRDGFSLCKCAMASNDASCMLLLLSECVEAARVAAVSWASQSCAWEGTNEPTLAERNNMQWLSCANSRYRYANAHSTNQRPACH